MKIAITGGTGFVGRHLARVLVRLGHQVVLISRGQDLRDVGIRSPAEARFEPVGISNIKELERAFTGCEAVAHCAGINREMGEQTYENVHIQGTRNVIEAARYAGVRKILLLSFLRARPGCGSPYHESKYMAEEIVRSSGLDYTVIKAGIIYGLGDHMLDHLSHALHTFPVFAAVGFSEKLIRPLAVENLVQVMEASLVKGRLSRQTVAVTGPEPMRLSEAIQRIAHVMKRKVLVFPLPVAFHYALGWVAERLMTVPLISTAQVRMLSEGIDEASPPCDPLPADLEGKTRFTEEQIRKGLPEPKAFGTGDLLNLEERRAVSRAGLGGCAWLLFAVFCGRLSRMASQIELLFLLAPLVLVPLGLGLVQRLCPLVLESWPAVLAHRFQLAASVCVLTAFIFEPGILAGALATPWLIFCSLLALAGLLHLFRLRRLGLEQVLSLLACAGLLFIAVGGGWLCASRLGLNFMGFSEPIVLLTAVHFHFTGFSGSMIAAAAGKRFEEYPKLRGLFVVAAFGMLLGTPLLAAGFVLSAVLKLLASLLLSLSFWALAALTLFVLPRMACLEKKLLGISSLSIIAGMALAFVYSVGEFRGDYLVDLSLMPWTHGVLNSLGFCLCGLLGWTIVHARESLGPKS